MDFVIHAQLMKLFQTENALVLLTTLETQILEYANLHAQLINSNIKEDVLNAH
jgi:hypothetical protein